MKGTIKKFIVTGISVLASISISAYAQDPQNHVCPNINSEDIENTINNGHISTDQGYTLADEAGITRAQVILNEPTANPFDTYYQMFYIKNFNEQDYAIYVGNLLGKTTSEAKERARKIFNKEVYQGIYEPTLKACIYESIDAALGTNYPFKSTYETAILISFAFLSDDDADSMVKKFSMKRKHRVR